MQDSTPRLISHLIVNQSVNNPAAVFAANENGESSNEGPDITGIDQLKIPNNAPDEGLLAPFNAFMTFFGQFFDHGLDLVNKGGNGENKRRPTVMGVSCQLERRLKPKDPVVIEKRLTHCVLPKLGSNFTWPAIPKVVRITSVIPYPKFEGISMGPHPFCWLSWTGIFAGGLAESKIDQHAGAARTLTKGSSSVMLQNGAHAGPLDLVVRWDSRA